MSTLSRLAEAALLFALAGFAVADDDERAQGLIEQHRWFELRGVTPSDPYGAALVKGALALAFNHPQEAEFQLKQRAVRHANGTDQLNAAREKLVALYLRQGRVRDAVLQMRAVRKRDPSRTDMQGMMAMFGALVTYPKFSARLPKGGAVLPCEVKGEGVWLRLVVNGKKVTWLLDTGFNFSAVSESEAKSLGIAIHDGGAPAYDFAGGETKTKSGVAARIQVGEIDFRNVPLLIFPDNQPPWDDWTPGSRGIVGLPLAIAMQAVSWNRDGNCHAGLVQANPGESNLAFDDFTPVVRGALGGKPIDFILDTGNQAGTQLWTRFKADFPDVLAGGGVTAGNTPVTQLGGANDRPTTEIPELRFEVGGLAAILKPARLFGKPVGNDYQHGLLGMDVFRQAREVVIDFRSMSVALR